MTFYERDYNIARIYKYLRHKSQKNLKQTHNSFREARSAGNYPMLLSSEPSLMSSITKKATLTERLELLDTLIGFSKFVKGLDALVADKGVTVEDALKNQEMHFMMGHPALSFAFFTPPNLRYLGFFTMKEHVPNPLPEPMVRFMDGCGDRPIIYMSFGTFLPDPTRLPWLKDFFHHLLKTDVCVLFKAHLELRKELSLPLDRVYIQYWMPQKDILTHKKIKFFLSHCGNNGRLEAIYSNTPILCIPLFTDQYLNGVLVQHREFGLLLVKEEFLEKGWARITESVNEMLQNLGKFKTNMAIAKETAINDPGSGKNVFLYHINYILKYGNARYLKNELISNQSVVEIYNLDVLALALLAIVIMAAAAMLLVFKLMKYFYQKVAKPKTD